MRDWQSTLWDASFKGVPFYVEQAAEDGGRRLAVHEFPRRDDPFIEDLGSSARTFELVAYLASDFADSDASGLSETFDSAESGLLVLPARGPVQAFCKTFKRDDKLDKLGYIAFQASFVRDVGASALFSSDFLAQLGFDAIDALTSAAFGLADVFAYVGYAGWLANNISTGLEDIVATVESVVSVGPIDSSLSGALVTSLGTLYNSIPANVAADDIADVIAATLDLASQTGAAMAGADAARAFAQSFDDISDPPSPSSAAVGAALDYNNLATLATLARIAFVQPYAAGVLRQTFPAREDAITARADFVTRCDVLLSGAVPIDIADSITSLRAAVIKYLSTAILDMAPVQTVTAQVSLPSVVAAWALYQNPTRDRELVARNGVKHPSFMPETFEALVS